MFFSFPGLLTIIILIILIPLLVAIGFFQFFTTGLQNLGISEPAAIAVILSMLGGSFINIPLTKKKVVAEFDNNNRQRVRTSGIAVNVGGAIIPLFLVCYLILQVPLQITLILTGVMSVVSFSVSRIVPRRGIALPMLLPPFLAALFSLILVPEHPAPVAFVSGVLGVLIGADVFRFSQMKSQDKQGMMVIGGAGVFDGIVLVGIVSALLAGLPFF